MANRLRCAIYTRKSTEEGLEQEFNSLDAQREACAAYILSQRHEGWEAARAVYDDGGYSGGSMERPALKQLLADVDAGQIDVIVVYKVDRLTRSLADFAKIVEVLDKRNASFVSVTQAFNTTTSMGRLTLNVLLSFAQFEREVTGERIRDKIAASKAKGMWMGGPVPLGYRVENRKLIVIPEDAQIVRHIFERYLALGCGQKLIEELHEQGYRTRIRETKTGSRGGVSFQRGALFSLLASRIYIGEITHKGTSYPGEHEAIIVQDLWEKVQTQIEANRVSQKLGTRTKHPSLLTGMIKDGLNRKMSPTHAQKGSRRYRYYITHSSELTQDGPPAWRMPALDLEKVVIERLQSFLNNKRALCALLPENHHAQDLEQTIAAGSLSARRLENPAHKRRIVSQVTGAVQVFNDRVLIKISASGMASLFKQELNPDAEPPVLTVSVTKLRQGKTTKLVLRTDDGVAAEPDRTLLKLLREAHEAKVAMMQSPNISISQYAIHKRMCRHRLAKLIRLSWLAPDIVTKIVEGKHPATLTAKSLLQANLPIDWHAQKHLLGFS